MIKRSKAHLIRRLFLQGTGAHVPTLTNNTFSLLRFSNALASKLNSHCQKTGHLFKFMYPLKYNIYGIIEFRLFFLPPFRSNVKWGSKRENWKIHETLNKKSVCHFKWYFWHVIFFQINMASLQICEAKFVSQSIMKQTIFFESLCYNSIVSVRGNFFKNLAPSRRGSTNVVLSKLIRRLYISNLIYLIAERRKKLKENRTKQKLKICWRS